jgi:hypothetical protein
VAFAIAACGGTTLPAPIDKDASTTDAAGDAARDATRDAPTTVDCKALEQKLALLRMQARTCCRICQEPQCGHLVDDVCCPISITGTAAPEFSAAVADYKRLCGPIACPAIVCNDKPSMECQPGPDAQSAGSCR